MPKKKINQELLLTARELYYEGLFFRQISEKLNISASYIQKLAHLYQWERHPDWEKERFEKNIETKKRNYVSKSKKMQEIPNLNEASLLDACKRTMWILENASVYN